jgi:hypothetical protein
MKTDATKSSNLWIPIDSIFSQDKKTTLKGCLTEIITFVHDAVRVRVDTVDLQIQLKEHDLTLAVVNDLNVKQQDAMKQLKTAIKERPKMQTLQEFIDKSDGQIEDLKNALNSLKENTESSIKEEALSFATLSEEVQRSNNTSTYNIKTLKEDMKTRAAGAEVVALSTSLAETKKQIATEIPKMQKIIDEKAGEEALAALRNEILIAVGELGSMQSKDNTSAMLGGRAYCLSCQQPVKVQTGPESDSNSK